MNNERILELALAADPDIGRTLGDLNGKCWIAANGIRPQSVVKFAELIVRECARCVTTGSYDAAPPYDKIIPVLLDELANGMKQHFGVGG